MLDFLKEVLKGERTPKMRYVLISLFIAAICTASWWFVTFKLAEKYAPQYIEKASEAIAADSHHQSK